MKTRSQNKGFTLIEIIVVLIILGVLAAIALPSLWIQVNRSRAAEAFETIRSMKTQITSCLFGHQDGSWQSCYTSCVSPMLCTYDIPVGQWSEHYEYIVLGTNTFVRIRANRFDDPVGSSLVMQYDVATQQSTCSGTGDYTGIC